MGIIPRGESPWGWAPTIRFGMAADAISVSETTYLTAVRYYLANLGTTVESQVRSFVYSPILSDPLSDPFYLNLSVVLFSSPSVPRCVPRPLSTGLTISRRDPPNLVAARLSRTHILAVTTANNSLS